MSDWAHSLTELRTLILGKLDTVILTPISFVIVEIHQEVLPVYTGTFRTQGAILTKAALNLLGLPGGYTRLPLVDATSDQIEQLRKDLIAGGVLSQ